MILVLICHVPVLVSDKKRISWFKKAGSNWGLFLCSYNETNIKKYPHILYAMLENFDEKATT